MHALYLYTYNISNICLKFSCYFRFYVYKLTSWLCIYFHIFVVLDASKLITTIVCGNFALMSKTVFDYFNRQLSRTANHHR